MRQARSHPIILALPRRECQIAGIAYHFMILYRLRCSKGHEFESWFKDSKSYERQEKKSLIGCAVFGVIAGFGVAAYVAARRGIAER